MSRTTLATLTSAGRYRVTVTADDRKPGLVGVGLGDECGPFVTAWLDAAGRAELVAALTAAELTP